MKHYNLAEIKSKIDYDLKKQLVSGKILLDRLAMIDESSRKSPSYVDPNYAGFYYHLGKYLAPESLMEFGFDIGIFPASFMTSCKSVKKFIAFRENDGSYYSHRIGRKNIKKVFKGSSVYINTYLHHAELDKIITNSLDMVIFCCEHKYDKQLERLDYVWQYLSEDGIMLCENLNKTKSVKDAFVAFCEGSNREPIFFNTRHGTGLVRK